MNETLKNAANKYGFNNYSGSLQDNYKLGQFLLGANQPKPVEVNTKIKANEIGNPISFPTYPAPSTSPLSTIGDTTLGKIESNQAQAQQDQQFAVDAAKETKDENFFKNAILNIFNKQADLGSEAAGIRAKEGVGEKRKEVTRLENEIKAKKLAYERQIQEREKNKSGSFGGALEQDVANIQREGNRELADLAIQYEAASGNYKDAYDIAEAKIKDLTQGLDDQLKALQIGYDFYKDDMTESQKLQAQQNFQIKQDERDQLADAMKYAYETAIKNGSSPSVLAAIGKATTPAEAYGAIGVTVNPSGFVPGTGQYAGALSVILGSGKFTKDQATALKNAINNGQDPFTVVKNQAKNILGTEGKELTKYESSLDAMKSLDSQLKQFYAAGGKSNIFTGNLEKVTNKLGAVQDPNLVDLAVQIAASLQKYRNAISGTAYSEQEGKDIAAIFPGISKGELLNSTIVKARINTLQSDIDSLYRSALGPAYDDLKSIQSSTYGGPVTAGGSSETSYQDWLKANGF